MLKLTLASGAIVAVCVLSSSAQSRIAFEVDSVRANTSGDRRANMRFTPTGDFTAVNQPVRVLLNFAFSIPLFRVEGMPDWFTSERFDVSAKAPAGLKMEPFAEVRGQLLRSLLQDRFALKARRVTKEMPVMALTVARDDRRLGPQLRPSDVDCDVVLAGARGGRAGGPAAAPAPPARPVCALGGSSAGPICGGAITMQQLAQGLSGVYQREVIDRTGLTGRYDFDLTFTPDNAGGPGIAFGNVCGALTGDRPAFSTAMLEQLGLRIESARAPVEVLVIDSAERPTAN